MSGFKKKMRQLALEGYLGGKAKTNAEYNRPGDMYSSSWADDDEKKKEEQNKERDKRKKRLYDSF